MTTPRPTGGSRTAPRFFVLLVLCTTPATSFAYFDPNAGGLLYQMLFPLIAAVVSIYVFLKQWVVRTLQRVGLAIRRLFRRP